MPERDIRTGTPSWVLVWKSATSSIIWNNIVFTYKKSKTMEQNLLKELAGGIIMILTFYAAMWLFC